jgi:phage baseplate assembly protein gpV
MDRRARIDNDLVATQALLKSHQSNIFTALPGIYKGAGKGQQTANVQPAVQAKVRNQNGGWDDATLPMCINCPIVFPGGGGFQLTFPLSEGDEGLIVFAQRCIDSWWQSGGVQPQAEMRMHDISDGFFIPAMLSQAKAPSTAASTSTVQLRDATGATYIEVAAGNVVNIHAAAGCNIVGPVNITGALTVSGTITGPSGAAITGNLHAAGTVQGGTVVLNTHIHAGVTTGGGVTAGPT